MKNLVTALLAALLCLSLIACGTTESVNTADSAEISYTAPIVSIEETIPDETASSWSVNNSITFSLLQNTYPVGTQKFTMVLENRGDSVLTYGEAISFEKYTGGQWKPVKTIDNYGFNSVAYLLQPHSVRTFTIDAWFVEKPLDAGLYRVTGSEVWTGETENQRATYPAWQLEFRISDSAQPEPDFSVYVSSVPLQMAETIPVHIINTTGKDSSILLIPHLDRQTADGQWEEVPYNGQIGFCGMSDPLPAGGKDWSEPIQTLWGDLAPGGYRLSYDITGGETRTRTAGGEFLLNLCGLPKAENFPS